MLVRIAQVAIIFFLVALVVFLVFVGSDNTRTQSYIETDNQGDTLVQQDDFGDSDGDGIPNWEEKLYGSRLDREAGIETRNDIEVVTEQTESFAFSPKTGGLIDVQKLIETVNGGGQPDERTLQSVLDSFSGEVATDPEKNQEEYLLIKRNLNDLGSPMIRSVEQARVDSERFVAALNGNSQDTSDLILLASLYQRTAQDIEKVLSKESFGQVREQALLLQRGFTQMASALNTIAREQSSLADTKREQQFDFYDQGQETVAFATNALYNLVTLRGITFATGEPGKYFAFEL